MKILLVSQLLPYPPKGGAPQRVYNLLKECAKKNEIHMLAFYRKSHQGSPAEIQKAMEALKRHCKKIEVFKIPAEHNKILWYLLLFFNLFSSRPYSVWLYSSRMMKRAIKRYLDNDSYDIIEFGEIGLANYARLVPRIPGILVHQNVESQLLYRRMKFQTNWLAKGYLWLQSVKLRRFERIAGRLFDFHTAVSEVDKKIFLKIYPQTRIAVIPNGVDTDYFRSTDDEREPNTLIYVGGMTWFPNYDGMLFFMEDILPLIRSKFPDIRLHCVGRQIDNRFHDMARADTGLEIHGFVDDVRPLITRASVFIVPLRIGGGTRLKIVDAMSMSKAVVSTSVGCEGLQVKDGHDIVIADSPPEFAGKVIEILRNPGLQDRLMSNARKTALEIYSWKIIAPMLIEVYQMAIQSRNKD
jgi:glycosyltransferase involved in cell wall biosynthesis